MYGEGVAQDLGEALKWYRLAAEQGNADALGNLASMYYSGEGVGHSHEEAGKWARLGAQRGHARSQTPLGPSHDRG